MADFVLEHGTHVLAPDGTMIGTVEDDAGSPEETGLAFLVRLENGRLLRIPHSMIDIARSGNDQVVLTESFQFPEEGGESGELTLPVREEQLNIHVAEKPQGKVRIEKTIEQVPVRQEVELGMHVVDIEHVPSDEEYDEVPQSWHDGDTLVIPIVEEVLVVARKFRVVENVRVTRRREARTETVEADLRREVVNFYEEDADGNLIEAVDEEP